MKKLIIWILLAGLLMIGGPWLTLTIFAGWNAMGICFILFFAINPLFSAICGAFAGRNIKQLWSLPIITAALFLIGAWLFFEMGEPAFLLYSGGYLIVGIITMLISAFLSQRKR